MEQLRNTRVAFVAKSFRERENIDFFYTFPPTFINVLIFFAAIPNLVCDTHQMNV
jgi:hypothetical protein